MSSVVVSSSPSVGGRRRRSPFRMTRLSLSRTRYRYRNGRSLPGQEEVIFRYPGGLSYAYFILLTSVGTHLFLNVPFAGTRVFDSRNLA